MNETPATRSAVGHTWRLDDLVLHRGPMSLLDRVQAVEDDSLVAMVEIREGIPFFAGCAVPAWVGLEYMAQAIAALAGARARREGRPIPLGLLIGCRKFVTRFPATMSVPGMSRTMRVTRQYAGVSSRHRESTESNSSCS